MTDKELLELAAKAAGIEHTGYLHEGPSLNTYGPEGMWAPLTSDGDALRLAVKLEFTIHRHPNTIGISKYGTGRYFCKPWQEIGLDEDAATRRAITRAAAEIGKMKGGK